jgi:SAM-dependent methyltransferase
MGERGEASDRWAGMLAAWAIPRRLVATAPASPYFFDPKVFVAAADEANARPEDTPSDRVAREALPSAGTVLDVGAGAGAASLRLGARKVIAVDSSRDLLDAFVARARTRGIEYEAVEGVWPAAASQAPRADVVVCHHVVYNVAGLADFAAALDAHAVARVVIELTAQHPMSWMAPYWDALHGLSQPDHPTADDAVAVLTDLGFDVATDRWRRRVAMIGETGADQVARIARRLCLDESRHDELRQVLKKIPPPIERDVVTIWWST